MPPLSNSEDERRRRAYEQTANDGAAARLLGMRPGGFAAWRMRVGLPAKTRVGRPLQAAEDDRRGRTYEATSNDVEAAGRLGTSVPAFRAWRDRRGLPSKGGPGSPRLTPAERRRRRALYHQGLTDEEMATRLGVTHLSICDWRRRYGLPPNPAQPLDASERHRRLAAYHACPNDAAAGRRLGMPRRKFWEWRVAEGLPAQWPPMHRPSPAEHARRLDAYHRTSNDREAARRLKMPHDSFSSWRVKADLVSKASRGPLLPPGEEARRHRIYWASPTDAAAARAIGLGYAGYTHWRRTRGLPPHQPTHNVQAAVVERRKRVIGASRSQREAAERLGVQPATIAAWARRYGVPSPARPRSLRRARGARLGIRHEIPEAAS